jgi:hypothetical protein
LDLRLLLHTDFANGEAGGVSKSQGGYVMSCTNSKMEAGEVAPWSPIVWRSYRVKRSIRSSLGGEASTLADGIGHLEWFSCFLMGALFSHFTLENRYEFLNMLRPTVVIDAKSAYDHVMRLGAPSSLEDKRCAIELMIARQALQRLGGILRWGPTSLMLADALTKEKPEAHDLLRACIRSGVYQLADEPTVLENAAAERERRKARKEASAQHRLPTTNSCSVCVPMVGFESTLPPKQARSLLEALACARTDYGKGKFVSSETKIRASFSAGLLDENMKAREGNMTVNVSYHDKTGYFHVQTGAGVEDAVISQLTALDEFYENEVKKYNNKERINNTFPPGLKGAAMCLRYPPTTSKAGDAPKDEDGGDGNKSAVSSVKKEESHDHWSNVGSTLGSHGTTDVSLGPAPEIPDDELYKYQIQNVASSIWTELNMYDEVRDDLLYLLSARYGWQTTWAPSSTEQSTPMKSPNTGE